MSEYKWRPPGLKILIEKQHPVSHSSFLKPCFWSALFIDSVSFRCWRHRRWSLKAPLPPSFLFSIPTVSSRLHCFSFSSSSHCTFHCKTLLLINPFLSLLFFPELFLPVWFLHIYWWERLGLRTQPCWRCCLPARPQNSGAWPLEMKRNTATVSSV